MITQIIKRTGSTEPWNPDKIVRAISLASKQSNTALTDNDIQSIVTTVLNMSDGSVHVDSIHTAVENQLMELHFFDVARSYIEYRSTHKPDIYRERKTILPYEYPQVMAFVDALHDSPWNHRHFNYDQDVAYYYDPTTPQLHKTIYARAQLAISQIEVAVKSYWKNVDKLFPKHEFSMLAACFDNSEAIHFNTYKAGLERIGLLDMYAKLDEYPVLSQRSNALQKAIAVESSSRKDTLLKNIMFSSFIENVSLMSQFVAVSAFDKYLKQYNGMSNGIKVTSIEESTHFLAGVFITETIKRENPELWTDELVQEIIERSREALQVEYQLIDWIFDNQDLEFLKRSDLKLYITKRMQDSLSAIGIEESFMSEAEYNRIVEQFEWFDLRIKARVNNDFFANKDTAYAKSRSFDRNSVFNDDFYNILEQRHVFL